MFHVCDLQSLFYTGNKAIRLLLVLHCGRGGPCEPVCLLPNKRLKETVHSSYRQQEEWNAVVVLLLL